MPENLSFTTAAGRARREAEAAAAAAAAAGEAEPTPIRPPSFDIDGEDFFYVADPPGGALLTAAKISQATGAARLVLIGEFLDAVLLEESRDRFTARLNSADNPIDLPTAALVVARLMEGYGGRPTVPSSL